MSTPYIGEIRIFAGNFAPLGWAFCNGQLMAVSQHDALFSLIGTIYGGDGQTTFALPDLRGRLPIHAGTGPGLSPRALGSQGGSEQVSLTFNQMPSHGHEPFQASTLRGNSANPGGAVLAESAQISPYAEDAPGVSLNVNSISAAGGSQPHTNVMPFQCVNFIISLFGIYPSPT
jgi:microcystin-dependent protein